jgi:hypothetical protein
MAATSYPRPGTVSRSSALRRTVILSGSRPTRFVTIPGAGSIKAALPDIGTKFPDAANGFPDPAQKFPA